MSYKDKAAYHGGRVNPEDEDKPQRLLYPCSANNCPMPGTMHPDQVLGEKTRGVCAWHYGAATSDWPRITQVLNDWACVSEEIQACRQAHCDPATALDLKALRSLYAQAVERLRPAVQMGGWGDQFEPRPGEHYDAWGHRLTAFIGARVVEVLSVNQRRAAA